jgi:CubicO group peptidase (beta-lactamase class C family)
VEWLLSTHLVLNLNLNDMYPPNANALRSKCAHIVLLLTLLSVSPFCSIAQPPSLPKITTVPELLKHIEQIMKQQQIASVLLTLVNKDSVIYSGALGFSDLESQKKADSKTLFRFGSVTKNLTALAILKLVHEGKISLDDRVKQLAPELPIINPWEDTNPIKVIHVLEHTTGFCKGYMFPRAVYLSDEEQTSTKVLNYFKDKLEAPNRPGEREVY